MTWLEEVQKQEDEWLDYLHSHIKKEQTLEQELESIKVLIAVSEMENKPLRCLTMDQKLIKKAEEYLAAKGLSK